MTNREILDREERADRWIMDIISGVDWLGINTNEVADHRWNSFSRGDLSHNDVSKISNTCRCPLCRRNSKVVEDDIQVAECPICYEEKETLVLSCNPSHRFCRECIEKIKK
jgi:hypothetical protein